MTCQATQHLFYPLLIGSESGMPSDKLVATLTVGRQFHTHTPVNTRSAGKDRMETPLQVSQPRAGTPCESGPDATPICSELLSSFLPLTPAGFTPEQGLSEGLKEVERLTWTTPKSSNPEFPSDEWGYANNISVLLAPSGSIATQAGN